MMMGSLLAASLIGHVLRYKNALWPTGGPVASILDSSQLLSGGQLGSTQLDALGSRLENEFMISMVAFDTGCSSWVS